MQYLPQMPTPSASNMLFEIQQTIDAFGDAFLAYHLNPAEMIRLRNCGPETPYGILYDCIYSCRNIVQVARNQRENIDYALHRMDALYEETQEWNNRFAAFTKHLADDQSPHEALELFKYDKDFASLYSDVNGYTPFMWACYNGHYDLVMEMLNTEGAVNLSDMQYEYGNTALLMSIEQGHTEIATQLIKNGADVFQARNDGYTPLMAAAEFGHTGLIEEILWQARHDAEDDCVTEYVNRSGGGGGKSHLAHTALMWAINARETKAALVLTNSVFSNADTTSKSGYNALIFASSFYSEKMEDTHLFGFLLDDTLDLEQETMNPWATTIFDQAYIMLGYTALLYACENGDTSKVEQLLAYGANPNHGVAQLTSVQYGYTPLMAAHGHYDITRLLIKAGADVRRVFKLHDGQLKTALQFAEYANGDGYDLIELAESLTALPPLPRSRASSMGSDDMPPLVPMQY